MKITFVFLLVFILISLIGVYSYLGVTNKNLKNKIQNQETQIENLIKQNNDENTAYSNLEKEYENKKIEKADLIKEYELWQKTNEQVKA